MRGGTETTVVAGHNAQNPEADSALASRGCFLLKKENVSGGADYPDYDSFNELDPNRVCVPNLVVKENSKHRAAHDNERPSEFHDRHDTPRLLQSQAAIAS